MRSEDVQLGLNGLGFVFFALRLWLRICALALFVVLGLGGY